NTTLTAITGAVQRSLTSSSDARHARRPVAVHRVRQQKACRAERVIGAGARYRFGGRREISHLIADERDDTRRRVRPGAVAGASHNLEAPRGLWILRLLATQAIVVGPEADACQIGARRVGERRV